MDCLWSRLCNGVLLANCLGNPYSCNSSHRPRNHNLLQKVGEIYESYTYKKSEIACAYPAFNFQSEENKLRRIVKENLKGAKEHLLNFWY